MAGRLRRMTDRADYLVRAGDEPAASGPRRAGAGGWCDRAGASPCAGCTAPRARRGRSHRRVAARGGGRRARGRRAAGAGRPWPCSPGQRGTWLGERLPRTAFVEAGDRCGGAGGGRPAGRPNPGRGLDNTAGLMGLDRGRPGRGGLLPPGPRGCRRGARGQPGPAAADRVRAAAHLARRLEREAAALLAAERQVAERRGDEGMLMRLDLFGARARAPARPVGPGGRAARRSPGRRPRLLAGDGSGAARVPAREAW